jgi:hypothetical protein
MFAIGCIRSIDTLCCWYFISSDVGGCAEWVLFMILVKETNG